MIREFKKLIRELKKLIEEILIKIVYKIIYSDKYESNTKFNVKAKSYITIIRTFSFDSGIYYIVRAPNISVSNKNLLECIFKILEHANIGMAKYNICKELLKQKNIRNFHY